MKFDEIKDAIEKIAPLEYGETWDNTGIQIRTENDEINKILVAMEINKNVMDEAIQENVDMIITHHPLIFSNIKSIDYNTVQGRYLIEAINNNISVYSAHLTFDNAPGGNNYYLAKILQLENVSVPKNNPENHPGVIGSLKQKLSLRQVCEEIITRWEIPRETLKIAGDLDMIISKIAICCGAGGDLIKPAIKEGCQLLITGDTKLHQAQKALAEGISLVDAGHYDTEKQFVENLVDQLSKEVDVEIINSKAVINPFKYGL